MNSFNLKPICSAAETYLATTGALVAAAVFVASEAYPEIAWTMGGPPAYYPRLLAVLLATLSIVVFAEGLVRPTAVRWPRRAVVIRMTGGVAVLALAPVGIGILGFLLAGILVSFALMALLVDWEGGTLQRVCALLLSSIGCSVVLFVVFRYLAGLRLPVGLLFD